MSFSVCVSHSSGSFPVFWLRWWRFIYSAPHVPGIDVTAQRQRITACLTPVHNPHLDALSIKSWDITWFVAFTARSHTCTQINAHAMGAFFFCVNVCSAHPPSPSNFPFLPLCLPSPVCPCRQMSVSACVCVCSQVEKRKRKACETSEFLWLQPSFLSSSLPLLLSPYRQLWIWHLNKYESALFFLFLSEDSHTPHKQQRQRRGGFFSLFLWSCWKKR